MKKYKINSSDKMQELGIKFSSEIRSGGIVCLFGDLGSGKTTFVKGIAIGLGIDKRIISPTFLLIRTYDLQKSKNSQFYHIDLYRLEDNIDKSMLGLNEIFANTDNIIAVEWSERLVNKLPKSRWDIKFKYLDINERLVEINKI